MLLTNLFQVWSPWLVRQAVDHLQAGVARVLIAKDAGLILLAVVLQGIFLFTMRMTLIRASRRIEYELRNDMFDHFARLPASAYRTRKVGDLMSRATNDLDAVRNFLGPGIMYSANTIVTFVMAVTLMCRIDVKLTLISLIPLPVLSLVVARLGARRRRGGRGEEGSLRRLLQGAHAARAPRGPEGRPDPDLRIVRPHHDLGGDRRHVASSPARFPPLPENDPSEPFATSCRT